MSTLTWITGKELEREVNNNGDQFRWKKNMKLYSGGEKMKSIEKKNRVNRNTNISSIKRVNRKLKVVLRFSCAKQRQGNVQKSVLQVQSCFLLIRSNAVVSYRSCCFYLVFKFFSITRFYIFFEETINI